MSIAASTYTEGPLQTDGRRYVTERHTDHLGVVHRFEYLATAGADHTAVMNARGTALLGWLADAEVEEHLSSGAPLAIQHQTGAQFLARLRALFRGAGREHCARIAKWIMDKIDAGEVTETQMQNAFGLTLIQWTNLKNRLTNLRSAYNAIQSAEGE